MGGKLVPEPAFVDQYGIQLGNSLGHPLADRWRRLVIFEGKDLPFEPCLEVGDLRLQLLDPGVMRRLGVGLLAAVKQWRQ